MNKVIKALALVVLVQGCSYKSFGTYGDKPMCMVDFDYKVRDCNYMDMSDCRQDLFDGRPLMCQPRSKTGFIQ